MPDFLQGDVSVPVVGKSKKWVVYGVGGLAATYVGWRWYQAKQSDASQPAQSDGTYTSPDLTEAGLNTSGGVGTVTGNSGSTTTDGTNPNAIDTNAEWTQKAVDLLGNAGYDGSVVYAALGEFLARRSLDKSEATIARAAIAAAGQPPVGGPYSVIEQASTGTGTLPAPTNLRKWDAPTSTQVGLTWDGVTGASHYRIFRSDQGEPIGDSLDTKFHVQGLQSNKSYSFYVRAMGSTGKTGGKSNVVTIKTGATKLAKPSKPVISNIKATTFRATTKAVPGAELYHWYVGGIDKGSTQSPYRDFTGASKNTTYKIQVAADTLRQSPGPRSDTATFKTKRK